MQKVVCFGDLVTFEWGQRKGFLGSQSEFQAAKSLFQSLVISTHQFELVTANVRGAPNAHFTLEILSGCIFEIQTDDGKDFNGIPVKYGTEINLRLRRSGKRMHSENDEADSLENNHSKRNFGFRLNPKYKFNAERQYILYQDLILFQEHNGRNLFVEESSCKLTFSGSRSTPFRILYFGVEVPDDTPNKPIMVSDIIQLYHNEFSACMAVESHDNSQLLTARTKPGTQSEAAIDYVPHLKRKSTKSSIVESSTLWQIESFSGHDKTPPSGYLRSKTPIRLRHILSDTYLTVNALTMPMKTQRAAESRLWLSETPNAFSTFSCGLQPHGSLELISKVLRKGSEETELLDGSNIQLMNLNSGHYVIVPDDVVPAGQDRIRLSAAATGFDGDILRITRVPDHVVQDVFILKIFFRAIARQVKELKKNPENPEQLSRTMLLLLKLMKTEQDGILLDRNCGLSKYIVESRQQSAVDIGFVKLSFQIVNSIPPLSEAKKEYSNLEVDLIRAAYTAVERLVEDNIDAVKMLVELGGMHKMIVHLGLFGHRGVIPPIASCLCVILNPANKHHRIALMTKHDVKLLFDQVYYSLLNGQVPLPAQYDILCLVCSNDDEGLSGNDPSDGYGEEQKRIRFWVCEMLLGKFHSGVRNTNAKGPYDFEPRHSAMIYRTQMNSVGELLISTSVYGQQRPSYEPIHGSIHLPEQYLAIKPPSFESRAEFNEPDEWNAVIAAFRYSIDSKSSHITLEQTYPEFIVNCVHELHGTVHWRRINTLTIAELEFYKSSLRLVSTLCLGRNYPCQNLIRKLIPVDHILYLLNTYAAVKGNLKSTSKSSDSKESMLFGGVLSSIGHPFVINREGVRHQLEDEENKEGDEDTLSHYQPTAESTATAVDLSMLCVTFTEVLCSCYLNSAVLPPIQHGLSSFQEKSERLDLPSWENLFLDECYNKVFSLMSQEDVEFIEISKSMTAVELFVVFAHCCHFLKSPYATEFKYTIPSSALLSLVAPGMPRLHNQQSVMSSHPQASFATMLPPIFGFTEDILWDRLTRMSGTIVEELFAFLLVHRQERKHHAAVRGIHSLIQRARLHQFIMEWIEFDAIENWNKRILQPVHTLVLIGIGSRELGGRKVRRKVLLTDIELFLTRLKLLKYLILRNFFDGDYNENPFYIQDDGVEHAFYSTDDSKELLEQHSCHFVSKMVGLHRMASVMEKKSTNPSHMYQKGLECPLLTITKTILDILTTSSYNAQDERVLQDEKLAMRYFDQEFGEVSEKHKSLIENQTYFKKIAEVRILCTEILVKCLENARSASVEIMCYSFREAFANWKAALGVEKTTPVVQMMSSLDKIDIFPGESAKGDKIRLSSQLPVPASFSAEDDAKFSVDLTIQMAQRLNFYSSFSFQVPSLYTIIFPKIRDLFELLYFKYDDLSYLILELFYLLGNTRAAVAQSAQEAFIDGTRSLTREHQYLLRQRTLLSVGFEKIDVTGFRSSSDSALQVRFYVHSLRNLLFNVNHKLCSIGLINFCTGMNEESNKVHDPTLRNALVSSLSNIQKAQEKLNSGILSVAIGKGETQKRLVLKRHTTPAHVSTEYNITEEEGIDDLKVAVNLLQFSMSSERQYILREYEFHALVINFFRNQCENIINESTLVSMSPSTSLLSHDLNTLFAMNVIFLRAFSHDNEENLRVLSSRTNVTLFLKLRNCHEEMIMLLTDIIGGRKDNIDEIMNEENLTDIFRDIKITTNKTASSNEITMSSNSIRLIEEILRVNHNGRLFDIIVLKLEQMLMDNTLLTMLGNASGRPFHLSNGSASAYAAPHTSVPFLCEEFYRITGFPTIKREDPYPLSKHQEAEIFQAFSGELKHWKFLPGDSFLALQLRMVSLMSTACHRSSAILAGCRTFFGSAVGLLHFLNIDKFELRGPYLSLFMNLWITTSAPDSIQADFESYSREMDVLLSSLLRDIRKYIFFATRLETLDYIGLRYYTHLEGYLLDTLLPFFSKILGSTVYVLSKSPQEQLKEGSITLSWPLQMKISDLAYHTILATFGELIQMLKIHQIVEKSVRMQQTVRKLLVSIAGQAEDKFNPTLASLCNATAKKLDLFLENFDKMYNNGDDKSIAGRYGQLKSHCVDIFVPICLQLLDDWSVGNVRSERALRNLVVSPNILDPYHSLVFKFCTNEIARIIYSSLTGSNSEQREQLQDYINSTVDPRKVLGHFIPKPENSKCFQHFRRWNRNGARLVQKIFSLISNQIEFGEFSATTKSHFRIIFWIDSFINGVLLDDSRRIEEEHKQDTLRMQTLLKVERNRLDIVQNEVMSLGGAEVVMTMMRNWSSLQPTPQDDGLTVLQLAELSLLIKGKGIDLGISLMEYGNKAVQDRLADIATGIIQDSGSAEEKSHFLLTAGQYIQKFRSNLIKSKGYTPADELSNFEKLLRLLTLFTEGHNSKTQNFVRYQGAIFCVDLVVEVCSLVEDLSKYLIEILLKSYYSEDELAQKHRPSVGGRRQFVINWAKDKESQGSLFKNLPVLRTLCKTLNAALATLCEFCQGPCKENQQVVARSRAFRHFGDLFRFFGAFQLQASLNEIDDTLESLPDLVKETESQWATRFISSYKQTVTHEGAFESVPLPLWVGFDPISIMLMVNRQNRLGTIPTTEQDDFLTSMLRVPHFSTAQINPKDEEKASQEWINTLNEFIEAKKTYIYAIQAHEPVPPNNPYGVVMELTEMISTLEISSINLINSVLEGIDEQADFPELILKNIRFTDMMANMANYWRRYIQRTNYMKTLFFGTDDKYCHEANAAFAYYGMVMRFRDLKVNDDVGVEINTWHNSLEIEISDHIARIEIKGSAQDELEVVYFPIPYLVRRYWLYDLVTIERNDILFPEGEINRDTIEEKLIDFLKRGENLKSILRHYQALDEMGTRNFLLSVLSLIGKSYNIWTRFQFMLSMALNTMLFLYFTRVDYDGDSLSSIPERYRSIFYSMSLAMVGVSFISLVADIIMKGWLYVDIGFSLNPHSEFTIMTRKQPIFYWACTSLYWSLIGRAVVTKCEVQTGGNVKVAFSSTIMTFYYYFTNKSSLYQWLLLSLSLVGFFVNALAYVGCMLEVLRMSSLMRYVTKSFTSNIDQVIAAVFLGAVIIYVFVAVNMTSHTLDHNLNGMVEGCSTMNQCTRLHFDYGILQEPYFVGTGRIQDIGAEIYNFFYVFIVNIVLPGVVSGIIIDTFSELRSIKGAVYDDSVNNCFICGIKREDFEAESVDFSLHVKNDHNMWKYLWYELYLLEKKDSDFTGCEQFVHDVLLEPEMQYKWLPLKKARCLTKVADKYDTLSIYNKVEQLEEKLNALETLLTSSFSALSEQQARYEDEKSDT